MIVLLLRELVDVQRRTHRMTRLLNVSVILLAIASVMLAVAEIVPVLLRP